MLEKDPSLNQGDVESILKSTALDMLGMDTGIMASGAVVEWDMTCGDLGSCDPVGAGLLQADGALAASSQ